MSLELNKAQIEELKESFMTFDKNGDGSISKEELKDALRLFGQNVTDRQVEEMINSVDNDGNGTIEFPEFTQLMGKHIRTNDTEVELKSAFNFFDLNGDGYITAAELDMVMRRLGEKTSIEEINDIINEGDKDGDGRISYVDFLEIMKS